MAEPLLEIKKLVTSFHTDAGTVRAVDGVDLSLARERTLGLVGESGSGKSVTALSVMGLVPRPAGRITSGEILFNPDGRVCDLARLDPRGREIRAIRGNDIAMIFQEPMTSLNPVFTIGNQIMEAIILHQRLSRRDARAKAVEMLAEVGIPNPEARCDQYPHQLSGGMRQRAMIAMALSCRPALLIADEPTTALDVTIQAQVLELMNRLRAEFRTSILFITHDLGVIAKMADHVAVMYLGKVAESGPVREIFHSPRHPYTQGLMHSIPSIAASRSTRLTPIEGVVPDLFHVPPGCGFAPSARRPWTSAGNTCRRPSVSHRTT
ncbi:MAG TPA: ABC transporter ATP-binding protein [Desulfobacterales bacterium]|nr:ABC transporter ATP-binding protein [Desulfobacterales bacterium]